MAYGVGIPTEVGYIYNKKIQLDEDNQTDNTTTGLPNLKSVLWEEPDGRISVEAIDNQRSSLAEHFIKKKIKRYPFEAPPKGHGRFRHSGDGSVPYLSLAWAHTWLLHAARARRFGQQPKYGESANTMDRRNALDHITISHRPRGALEWVNGPPHVESEIMDPIKLVDTQDTGVDHPHGTRYKPLMTRYHNVGTSRTTGIEYTTTIIEAVGVEHKETTRYVGAFLFGSIWSYC
jgi:hypothetical protein